MTCAWSTLEWCGSFDPEVSLTIFMGCPCSAADYIIYVRSPMDSSQFWNEELYTLTQKIVEVENAEFSHFFEGGASVLDSTSFWDFQTQGGWPWHEMSSGLYQRFRGELCKLSGKYRGSIPLLEGSLSKEYRWDVEYLVNRIKLWCAGSVVSCGGNSSCVTCCFVKGFLILWSIVNYEVLWLNEKFVSA